MSKKLIITEKPSVARDFARVLRVDGRRNGYIENDTYVISWCFGHLVEMVYPESYDIRFKTWRVEDLPFLPKDYKYGIIESAKEQYHVVNSLLHREDIDTVYWAGDSGKEGQTIEENIRNFGGVRQGMTELRVWIDSQTDEEILRGIREAKPMSEYDLLGKSGIMRAIEDYSLGINFSRALSVKYGKLINDAAATESYTAIAIGRVMTCVLGMVVRREREIRDFVETPFYRVVGNFSPIGFEGEWKAVEGSKYENSPLLYKENGFKKQESAEQLIDEVKGQKAVIEKIESGINKKKAPLLFNLAELQSECSKRFKISPAQSLQIAQELYEKKLTTYPRTDARVLTVAVSKEIKKNLYGLAKFEPVSAFVKEVLDGNLYANLAKTSYVDDKQVTDHYAIIPTGQLSGLNGLSQMQRAVYELIARRFLSIFFPPAEYKTMKLQILVDRERFFTSAKVLVKPGYLRVAGIPSNKENEDKEEGEVNCSKEDFIAFADSAKQGDEILVNGYSIKEGKTSPPKRYTSGNLILAMENAGNLIEDEELREQIKKSGIGTSATRGEILEKLVRIKYLNQNNKTQIITPEKLGEMIYEVVDANVPSLLNPEMTASWEKGLEGIVRGTVDDKVYRAKLEAYIREETTKMIGADMRNMLAAKIHPFTGKNSKGAAMRKPLGIACPACGGELTTTSFGYGCSNYWNKENKCNFNLGAIAGLTLEEEDFVKLITEGKTDVLKGFKSKSGAPFQARLLFGKKEDGSFQVNFDFTDVEPEAVEGVTCPDCGGKILRKGQGYGCANFDQEKPDTCRFYIGKIAQKQLNDAQLIELLTEKKTKTIRGFKGKTGKKFDACLVLKQNETGKHEVGFDFEAVEKKVIKDVVCPVCGGAIEKTFFGYGCSNYDRENPASCKFMIGSVASVKLKDSQVKELLTDGITSMITGFKSKAGKKFDARLALARDEAGKVSGIKFVFENTDVTLNEVLCPKCKSPVIQSSKGYRCSKYSREEGGCKFYVGAIAGYMLTVEQLSKLLKDGYTEQIDGFISKSGSSFSAYLKLDEQGSIVFDFNNPAPAQSPAADTTTM